MVGGGWGGGEEWRSPSVSGVGALDRRQEQIRVAVERLRVQINPPVHNRDLGAWPPPRDHLAVHRFGTMP